MTVDLAARMAPVVGLQLAASLYPYGDPVRDRAHLALLERFRVRLDPRLTWLTEVPVPIAGDPRSGDAVIETTDTRVLVEAETRITDVQAVERKAFAKARDLGADRVILLLADTANNRQVLHLHPEFRVRFPVSQRTCLVALARGDDPGGDAIVIV